MFKRSALMVVVLAGGLSMQGCDETAVAVGAGVVGGAIVAGAATGGYYGGYYRRGCYSRYDGYYYCRGRYAGGYYGNRWYRGDRWNNGRNHGGGYHGGKHGGGGRHSVDAAIQTVGFSDSAEITSAEITKAGGGSLSKKYGLSAFASKHILNAFKQTKSSGRLENLRALGLGDSDLNRLQQGRIPSSSGMNNMAATLQTSSSSVKALIRDVASEYSLQKQYGWKL